MAEPVGDQVSKPKPAPTIPKWTTNLPDRESAEAFGKKTEERTPTEDIDRAFGWRESDWSIQDVNGNEVWRCQLSRKLSPGEQAVVQHFFNQIQGTLSLNQFLQIIGKFKNILILKTRENKNL